MHGQRATTIHLNGLFDYEAVRGINSLLSFSPSYIFYSLSSSLRPSRFIEMSFSLGKVIAVRFKRFTKNRRDASIPAGISGAFPSPLLASDSSPAHTISARRESGLQVSTPGASDAVQLSLSVLQPIAGLIPLAGGPMQAAINGLLATLQAIDVRDYLTARTFLDFDGHHRGILRIRQPLLAWKCDYPDYANICAMRQLRGIISNNAREMTWSGIRLIDACLDLSDIESHIRVLEATSEQLTRLSKRFLVYQSVTQAITGCSSDLDQYLQEYSLSAQMQIQNVVVETRDILVQQFRGPTTMQPGTFTPGCFTLVDATGRERHISVDFGTSYEQLNKLLEALFLRDTKETRIQRQYMEQGLYNLCIDMGTQVTTLESQHGRWPRIEAGMKIVMRVIFEVEIPSSSAPYRCHSCGASNYSLQSLAIKNKLQEWTVCCRECKRRYQISIVERSHEPRMKATNRALNHSTSTEMPLITNFDVQEFVRAL
ncbi:hypothetical protein AZE42_01420 [Rhizopogon vesiculosus]|uniref:Ubiquitin-like domain-containing protein n=1 Tax=Rhizopogon vesiculosus TaxID=180088 RepID=A0A1J8Q8K5_9AGAM|nr:hypothetical protein AZE42_01420 [Rhizopogon vesiculosus]